LKLSGAELLERIDSLPPDKQMVAHHAAIQLYGKSAETVSPLARPLEALGWRAWYAAMFGQAFVDSLDSAETDDKQHSEAIEWHWNTRRALIQIEVETRCLAKKLRVGSISQATYDYETKELELLRPIYLAYFTIWARGNLKTTIARRVAVCDACLSASAGVGGYGLIVGGTKAKVRGTANSINALLTKPLSRKGSEVWRYYPKLAEVKRNKFGYSQGWTTDLIVTDADYIFHFAGLDEGMAGANEEDVRPTFILPDDIDNRRDSTVIAERNFQTFTTEILPMRQSNTLVFWAQNLISRYSTMYRVWKQQVRVLTNRVITDPIPAVRNLVTEVRTIGGIVKDVYVSGKATWRAWSRPGRIQEEIDTYGLPAFLRECQHEVEQDREGLVLQYYNDSVHVISKSEFASVFGTREMPQKWIKHVGNDWSRTKTKHHANVAGILTVSGQSSPLPGHLFFFNPMSFPAATEPEEVAKRLLSVISETVHVGERNFTWDELVAATLQKTNLEHLISNQTELIDARRSVLASVIPGFVRPIIQAQNYRVFRGSHEQSKTGALSVYRKVFGLPFVGVNPGGDGGIATFNMLMKVDYTQAHAIRKDAMGYTMFHIVVDDDRSATPRVVEGVDVYPPIPFNDAFSPDDLHDADLIRYQFKNCRYRDPYLTAQGEKEGEILKMDDDFINLFMMLLYDRIPQAAPLTVEESREFRLNPTIRTDAIARETNPLILQAKIQSRELQLKRMEAKERRENAQAARFALPKVRFRR
jgi:hypothetical protein